MGQKTKNKIYKNNKTSMVEFRIDEESCLALRGQTLTLCESTRLAQQHSTLNIILSTPK
jgi:hypothetical protein